MPAIQIQILSVSTTTTPTTKGSYQTLDVAFRNLTYQNKVEGKKIISFNVATADTFKVLASASKDEIYDIETNKNNKGYIDWVKASRGVINAPSNSSPDVAPGKPAYNASPKSTYETPEERAKKQIYIVRQSSISNAIELLSTGAKTAPSIDDVVKVAKTFEDYVFGTSEKQEVSVPNFDDLEDIPL